MNQIQKIVKEKIIDIEEHWKKKGLEEGIEKGMSKQELEDKKVFSTSLILKTAFDDAKIAGLVGVDVSFVQKLREQVER